MMETPDFHTSCSSIPVTEGGVSSSSSLMVKPGMKRSSEIDSINLVAFIWLPKKAYSCHMLRIKNSLSSKMRGITRAIRLMAPCRVRYCSDPFVIII